MPSASELYQKAISAFKASQLLEASQFLEQAYLIEPKNPEVLEALGVIYGHLGRVDDAIRLMKELAAIQPDYIMSHTNLSQLYARKGLIDEAEHEQAEARRLSWKEELRGKKMSESEIQKLSIEQSQAQIKGAQEKIEQYKKVIEYDPKDVLGYFTLATVYLQISRFAEAEEMFQKAIEVNPNHSPSYVGLTEALEALGKLNEAEKIYQLGIPVADKNGDIIPLRKMQTRLSKLQKSKS